MPRGVVKVKRAEYIQKRKIEIKVKKRRGK